MWFKVFIFLLLHPPFFCAEHVYLKAPTLSKEGIIGSNVGIRPFRMSGVRLEAESIRNKIIIHNYGYGGSGMTLAFGGSQEVLQIIRDQNVSDQTVAVLGGGVVGLATAYDLLENGYEVHLYSDAWSPHLTSDVATGNWTPPILDHVSDQKKELYLKMLEHSEQRFLKSIGSKPEFVGVSLLHYYNTSENAFNNPNDPRKRVILHFDNGVIKQGVKSDHPAIDGKLFMADLFVKVKNKGARVHEMHFNNLEEILSLKEPIIVNCMSLGARDIFNDPEFVPTRGQMIYFIPQSIDYSVYYRIPNSIYSIHLFPWSDRLILGGVSEEGVEEAAVDPEVINYIFSHAKQYFSN